MCGKIRPSQNATSFLWQFPGGIPAVSNEQNPVVMYNSPENYSVVLIVENGAGSDTVTQINFITVNTIPTAGFASNVNDSTVTFTNTSANAASYLWNFGDGVTSTLTEPSHTYTDSGTYMVMLIAANNCGTDTSVQIVTPVFCIPPEADFSVDLQTVCVGQEVHFISISANATILSWNFPGGDPIHSIEANPVVTYSSPGAHSIVLNAINACGNDQEIKYEYIDVMALPIAYFVVDTNCLTVMLDNESYYGDSYLWEFGDGLTDTTTNPTEHEYAVDGTYTIWLTVQNECGTSTFEDTVTVLKCIVALETPAQFLAFRLFPNPAGDHFTLHLQGEPRQDILVELFNSTSQTVLRETLDFQSGALLKNYSCRDLPAGMYLIRVSDLQGSAFRKIIIE